MAATAKQYVMDYLRVIASRMLRLRKHCDMKNLEYVDAMRGIAILMVIVVHTAQTVQGISYAWIPLAKYGQMGVQLFFVASAYTLCLTFLRRKGEPRHIVSFFIRRFFRIAPLYYVAITLYFVVNLLRHLRLGAGDLTYPYSVFNIFSNVVFIHGFVPSANNNIVPGGWSIGTEMAFYLCFPILFAWFARLNAISPKMLLGATLLCLGLNLAIQMIMAFFLRSSIENNTFLYFNFVNQLPVFLLGMAIFFFHKDDNYPRFVTYIPLQIVGFVLCTACVLVLWKLKASLAFAVMPTIAGMSFVFLLNLLRVISNHSTVLRAIGRLSYSMYIFHFVFAWYIVPVAIKIIHPQLSPDLIFLSSFVLVVGFSFAVAVVTERHVEAKGIALGNAILAWLHARYRPSAASIK